MNTKEREMKEAVKDLRAHWLKPNDTVYTLVTHVSRSGMQRVIRVLVIKDNKPLDISYATGRALGWKRSNKHDGVVVNGCGMDMGFHLVYALSCTVFADEEEKQETNNLSKNVKKRDRGYWLLQRWF